MEKHFDINEGGYSVRCKLFAHKDARTYQRVVICTHGYGGTKDRANIAKFAEKETSKYKTDAVIAFPLSPGTHTIELNYSTPGLGLGALISGISVLALALLLWLCRGKHVLIPDRAPEEIESRAEWKALAEEDFQKLSELTMPELTRPQAPPEEDETASKAAEDPPSEETE